MAKRRRGERERTRRKGWKWSDEFLVVQASFDVVVREKPSNDDSASGEPVQQRLDALRACKIRRRTKLRRFSVSQGKTLQLLVRRQHLALPQVITAAFQF